MDVTEPTARVKSNLGSSSKTKSPKVTLAAIPALTTHESFEWVQHGDASARRRARAHVTRGFRRQKAEAAELAKIQGIAIATVKNSNSPLPDEVTTENRHKQKVYALAPKPNAKSRSGSPFSQHVVGAKPTMQDFILVRQVGSGETDPFDSLPVKLDSNGHSILEHFLLGVAPMSYNLDSRSDFNPVKALSFQVSLTEASAFHIIIAVGAGDKAILQGKQDSSTALKHRGLSMNLVNQRLMRGDTSDASIAGIALLAGSELLYGTPKSFDTHMRGLTEIVKIRGGLETFRKSNFSLYGWISWCDYTGSCNFVRRRSLLPVGPSKSGAGTDPFGCPDDLMASLPAGYDLFEHVTNTFRHWEVMITFMHSLDSAAKMQELMLFVRNTDAVLYHSLALANIKGNKGRRHYIQQCLQIFSLICGAVFARFGGEMGEVLFGRLEVVFNGQARIFFGLFGDLCHELSNGAQFDERSLHDRVGQILDACGLWAWEEWQVLKKSLMDFFLIDEICAGPLQTLWRHRMSHESFNDFGTTIGRNGA